jgi:hypothetical protein
VHVKTEWVLVTAVSVLLKSRRGLDKAVRLVDVARYTVEAVKVLSETVWFSLGPENISTGS